MILNNNVKGGGRWSGNPHQLMTFFFEIKESYHDKKVEERKKMSLSESFV
jgi:hypothetical protein